MLEWTRATGRRIKQRHQSLPIESCRKAGGRVNTIKCNIELDCVVPRLHCNYLRNAASCTKGAEKGTAISFSTLGRGEITQHTVKRLIADRRPSGSEKAAFETSVGKKV